MTTSWTPCPSEPSRESRAAGTALSTILGVLANLSIAMTGLFVGEMLSFIVALLLFLREIILTVSGQRARAIAQARVSERDPSEARRLLSSRQATTRA